MSLRRAALWRMLPAAAVVAALPLAAASPGAMAASGARTLGVSLQGVPGNLSGLDSFNRRTHSRAGIVSWFRSFQSPLIWPGELERVGARGAIPMITWEPEQSGPEASRSVLKAIVAGTYDAYLRTSAQAAARWGHPLLIRFAHEMNGFWYQWGVGVNGNRPRDYINAWRHVVQIFREQNATRVRWVWCPNVEGGIAAMRRFYPGDYWVDWVAIDGFNWGKRPRSTWRPIRAVFEPSYTHLARLTRKPMMIAEVGVGVRGGSRARWITTSYLRDVPRYMPRVRAIVYFNWNAQVDWRLETSPAAIRAYRRVAASRGYRAPFPG